ELRDSSSRLLSDNFYWLSAKLDTLDWAARKDTVYTPQKDFADLTGLNDLPAVKLDAKAELVAGVAGQDTQQQVHITVKNPSKSVAFMVHLRATHGPDSGDITPIFWSDNYFSLLPGESRQVFARLSKADRDGPPPVIRIDGYNVAPNTIGKAT